VAVLVDLAMWADGSLATGGFGLALLFVLVPVLSFVAIRSWRGSPRLAVITGLLAAVGIRSALDPTPSVTLAGLGLVGAFVLALRKRSLYVPDVVLSAAVAAVKLPSRVKAWATGVRRMVPKTGLARVSVLPIVIPAGLVAVFLGVFALANPVVARVLGTAWTALGSIVAFPSVGRMFLWLFALVVGISLLRPALRRTHRAENAPTTDEATTTALSIARNALVGLNVIFFAYNAIDATYLWTGAPPAGMHTQQYAHQGAFWLTVALLMLTAVIGVMFRGALAHDARAKLTRRLAFGWMGQGLVLALGTYGRIGIHIAKSGLSDLRIVGILGTSLVVCGVVLVGLKLRQGKTFGWLVRRQLDAFALTAIVYAIAPTHLVSASVNVARVTSGEYRPVLHAFRQSHETESAAALLPLLDHSDVRVRQGVAALLEDERQNLRKEVARQKTWRERDLTTWRALGKLDEAAPRIERALGAADPTEAKRVLLAISRAANEDRSLEEILAIGAASDVRY
jgi:hypothetical protein